MPSISMRSLRDVVLLLALRGRLPGPGEPRLG